MVDVTRRHTLQAVGSASLLYLAGCSGDGGGGSTLSGEDYPLVDEWLTETEIGAADDTYGGAILDRRERETVEVQVGAEGNGDYFAFDPSAVAVSVGATVEFVWTGEGGAHNVEALPEEQLGESDYEFSSGEPVDQAGRVYSRSMDDAGIALYHCEPHLSVGMKGAIVVE